MSNSPFILLPLLIKPMPSLQKTRLFVDITRPYTTTPALLSFSIGYFIYQTEIKSDYFIGLIIILLAHSIADIQNDIADIKIDKVNSPKRPLAKGLVSISEAKKFILVLIAILLFLGLIKSPMHLLIAITFLLISWIYSFKPLELSHQPLFSVLTLATSYTIVPFIYGFYLNSQRGDVFPIYLLLFLVLVKFSISILKDFGDEKGDLLFKKITFYIKYGKESVFKNSLLLAIVGYIGILVSTSLLRHFTWLILLSSVPAFFSIYLRKRIFSFKDEKSILKTSNYLYVLDNQFQILVILLLVFIK